MKENNKSVVALMIMHTLIFSGPLVADVPTESEEVQMHPKIKELNYFAPVRSKKDDQFLKTLTKEAHCGKTGEYHERPADPRIEHLYAFNSEETTIIPPGEDFPFNNGNSDVPPTPLQVGRAIKQLDKTVFLIFENGDYLVTFYGYPIVLPTINVQLVVNGVPTGPAVPTTQRGLLSFSQIIRITGATKTNPARIEIRFNGEQETLTLQSGVNATLEIIQLNHN